MSPRDDDEEESDLCDWDHYWTCHAEPWELREYLEGRRDDDGEDSSSQISDSCRPTETPTDPVDSFFGLVVIVALIVFTFYVVIYGNH